MPSRITYHGCIGSRGVTLRDRPPGETPFDALRRWIDAMFDEQRVEEDEVLLRKRLCREDEGPANFRGHQIDTGSKVAAAIMDSRPYR